MIEEPFQPEPVLTFLGHLGVSRAEIHRRIMEKLRNDLENQITSRGSTEKDRDVLMKLLVSCWQFIAVPDLRPVVATLIKKLGEETPTQLLRRLAERDGATGEPKHAELLAQFGRPMRRLVWEADWDAAQDENPTGGDVDSVAAATATATTTSNGAGSTFRGPSVLAEMLRPAIQEYVLDEAIRSAADWTFVSSIRDRKIDTPSRRSNAATSNNASSSAITASVARLTGHKTSIGTDKKEDGTTDEPSASAGSALAKIKDIIGNRPKLLSATLNMLVAEHGFLVSTTDTPSTDGKAGTNDKINHNILLLGGMSHLNCTLIADIMLSYGPLPKPYEHVAIMARVLDGCVRDGVIPDDVVAQIQGCLRVIYQQSSEIPTMPKDDGGSSPTMGDKSKQEKASSNKAPFSMPSPKRDKQGTVSAAASFPARKEDREFYQRLLRKVITAAIVAMKKLDNQGLFLNPVTDQIAPGYSDLIKKPMCIRTIEEKVGAGKYLKLSEYEDDVLLMFENCITYNIGKEGQWFRGEAKRQRKAWREEILGQASAWLKAEGVKRKKALLRAEADKVDKKRKRDEMLKQEKEAKEAKAKEAKAKEAKAKEAKAKAVATANTKKGALGSTLSAVAATPMPKKKWEEGAITRLTADDIEPIPASKAKRRKKDLDHPSMPALACMLLADPFVVRLLIDRIIRAVRSDVLGDKSVPAVHKAIPSMLQLLHLARRSMNICSVRGRKFFMPDAGLDHKSDRDGESGGGNIPELAGASFDSLRKSTALLGRLIMDCDLDRRTVPGGDLHDAASSGTLPERPVVQRKEWSSSSSSISPSSNPSIVLALVEGALVHLLQPGVSNEAALKQQQLPRFAEALHGLSGGRMTQERPFFDSLRRALLRHRTKLSRGTRDVVVTTWLTWFGRGRRADGKKRKKKKGRAGSMAAPVHYCFIELLNEWAALGNLVLPRDKLLSLAEDAVDAAATSEIPEGDETNNNDDDNNAIKKALFATAWKEERGEFSLVKEQYEKMLKSVPEDRAQQWKEKMGIADNMNSKKEEEEEMATNDVPVKMEE